MYQYNVTVLQNWIQQMKNFHDETKRLIWSGKLAPFKGKRRADSSFVRQYERKRTVGRRKRRWKDEEWLLRILENEDDGMWSGLEWLGILESSLQNTLWNETYTVCVWMPLLYTKVTLPGLQRRKLESVRKNFSYCQDRSIAWPTNVTTYIIFSYRLATKSNNHSYPHIATLSIYVCVCVCVCVCLCVCV